MKALSSSRLTAQHGISIYVCEQYYIDPLRAYSTTFTPGHVLNEANKQEQTFAMQYFS